MKFINNDRKEDYTHSRLRSTPASINNETVIKSAREIGQSQLNKCGYTWEQPYRVPSPTGFAVVAKAFPVIVLLLSSLTFLSLLAFCTAFWSGLWLRLLATFLDFVRCASFEAMYGRKCHSPIMWAEVREGQLIGPKLVQETTEKISHIKDRLKAARDRQKSVVRFGKKGKLAPRFVGPFEIIEKVGPVAYLLDLPEELNGVHDTFHVSNLKKCLADPTLQVLLDEIQVDARLNFVEEPMEILEREFKKLKRSRIAIVKVRWNSKRGPEFTWEREDQMKLKYPHLFSAGSS
ncbi:hypothetical protein Tco_1364670 [Tanacetum coccineum]